MDDLSAHARLPVTDLSENKMFSDSQKIPERLLRDLLCSVSG